jgi:hypothetical protein
VASLALCALVSTAQAAWNQPVAGSLNISTSEGAFNPQIAHVGGVPYVAWAEVNSSVSRVYVKRFDGTAWGQAGSGSLNVDPTKNADSASIASVGGVPYAAWAESNGSAFQIHVKRFDGTAWVQVGSSLNVDTTRTAEAPIITDVGAVPYVAWEEFNGTAYQIYVKRFDGTAWVPVGSSLNHDATKPAGLPSIASVGGVPYVAWGESNGTVGEVYVKRFDGSTWVQVGSGSLNVDPTHTAGSPSVASVGGVPYVAWGESNGPVNQVYVKRFDGSAWGQVGSGSLNVDPTQNAGFPTITSVGGAPLVGWQESHGTATQIYVKRFGGGAWAQVGGSLNVDPSKDASFFLDPKVIDVGGVPYASWAETDGSHYQIRVKRLEPDILSESATPSATGATLRAQVNDYGVPLPIGFELGNTGSFGTATALTSSAGTGVSTLTQNVSGLTTATTYFYRAFGSDTFRETSQGPTQRFTTLPASLSNLRVSPSKFSLAGRKVKGHCVKPTKKNKNHRRCRRPITLRVSYTLNVAGTVTFTLKRQAPGRKVKGRCVTPTRKNRKHRKCTRLVSVRGKIVKSGKAGANQFSFNGKIGGHTLGPGTYELIATPTRGNSRKVTFKIVP